MVFFEPFISPNLPSQDDYLPPSFEFLFTSYDLMTSQSSQTDVIANDKDGYMCATWGRLNMGPLYDLFLNSVFCDLPLCVLIAPQNPTQMQVPIDAISKLVGDQQLVVEQQPVSLTQTFYQAT